MGVRRCCTTVHTRAFPNIPLVRFNSFPLDFWLSLLILGLDDHTPTLVQAQMPRQRIPTRERLSATGHITHVRPLLRMTPFMTREMFRLLKRRRAEAAFVPELAGINGRAVEVGERTVWVVWIDG